MFYKLARVRVIIDLINRGNDFGQYIVIDVSIPGKSLASGSVSRHRADEIGILDLSI